MNKTELMQLSIDMYNGVETKFDNGDTGINLIRNMITEAFGNIDMSDKKAVRNAIVYNKVDYAIINEVINVAIETGMIDDSPIWDCVEYKSGAEGDLPKFTVTGSELFHVDVVTAGTQGIRRQRIIDNVVNIQPERKAIKCYEELARLASGRIEWARFVDKVAKSFNKDRFDTVASAFKTASYPHSKNGAYTRANMLDLIQKVQEDGGNVKIFGSLKALDNLAIADTVISNKAKDDVYNFGYVGKFMGVDCYRISGKDVSDNQLFVISTDDKFVKMYDSGDTLTIPRAATDNGDLTQELTVFRTYGVSVVLGKSGGVYTIV